MTVAKGINGCEDALLRHQRLPGAFQYGNQALFWSRYQPIYINMRHAFRGLLSRAQIERCATECALRAMRSNQATERYIQGAFVANATLTRPFCPPHLSLEEALSEGMGVIVATFRFGLHALLPAICAEGGYRVTIPLVASKHESITSTIQTCLRARIDNDPGCSTLKPVFTTLDVANVRTAQSIASALRRNEVVIVYADGNKGTDAYSSRSNCYCINLLGRPILVKAGVTQLSSLLSVPILPVIAIENSDGSGHLAVGDLIRPPKAQPHDSSTSYVIQATQQLFSFVEAFILQMPGQWEAVDSLHKWRFPLLSANTSKRDSALAEAQIEQELNDGCRYTLSSDAVYLHADTKGEHFLVNVETLQVVRGSADLTRIARQLTSTQGISLARLRQLSSYREKQTALRLLASLNTASMICRSAVA